MKYKRLGDQTVVFENKPRIIGSFSVVGGKDGYLRNNLDDLSLNCVGFYDTATGSIDSSGCPFVISELADIPNINSKVGDKK